MQVVRTRRVRAIEERFSGRTARMFYVARATSDGDELGRDFNDFEVAAGESVAAFGDGKLWVHRHARISEEQASDFWERVAGLVRSSTGCRGRATRSTDSRSASIRPTIRDFRPPRSSVTPG